MNAPYGVMRCTVPSTTAPTSRSAISSSFEPWSETSPHPGSGNYPIGAQGRQYVKNWTCRARPRRPLTGGRLGCTVLGHDHERHLTGLDHAEALPGQVLQIRGIVQLLDPLLELLVLVLEDLGLPPE